MNKIVLSTVVALFLLGCSENKQESTVEQETAPVAKQEVTQSETKVQPQKPVTKEKETVQEEVKQVKITKPVKKEVEVVKKEMKQEVTKVVQELKPAINGAKLFSKCVACHGANAEKKALNKSHVIRGWSEEKIMTAFHGYKAGTYGSTMKGVMKAQIANFNEEELKALAKHISKL